MGGGGQADGPDVLVEADVGVQLHQGDVVVIGFIAEVFVGDDPSHPPLHCPLVGLTLHMQTQQRLPVVGFRVSASDETILLLTLSKCAVHRDLQVTTGITLLM